MWKRIFSYIIATILQLLTGIIIAAVYWSNINFGKIDFDKIIFHLKAPLEGTNMEAFTQLFVWGIIGGLTVAAAGLLLALNNNNQGKIVVQVKKKKVTLPLNLWNKHYQGMATVLFLIAVVIGLTYLGVPVYAKAQLHASTIFEDYYVEPATAQIEFPQEKRNLVYIFMESMEDTSMDVDNGGMAWQNMIPELTELQRENTAFSASDTINGAITTTGTDWTIAAMIAQTSGIPLKIPVDGNSVESYDTLLTGAYSIGQILEQQGYEQVFLLGSDAEFGGREAYMTQHGDYSIEDYDYAVQQGWIDKDYYVWWGYEDQKLYENAKEELTRLSSEDAPFNLTMLTVDTHFPDGYMCEQCGEEQGWYQYGNVMSCASRQVTEFVSWMQQQPFYENTTIVICGDHPTMDGNYVSLIIGDQIDTYQRHVYTTIINSAQDYKLDYDRVYTTMDMYPTTLASLGVIIKGDRLALGTNLYSDTPTLIEQLGIEELNTQLSMNSKFYNKNILYAE